MGIVVYARIWGCRPEGLRGDRQHCSKQDSGLTSELREGVRICVAKLAGAESGLNDDAGARHRCTEHLCHGDTMVIDQVYGARS